MRECRYEVVPRYICLLYMYFDLWGGFTGGGMPRRLMTSDLDLMSSSTPTPTQTVRQTSLNRTPTAIYKATSLYISAVTTRKLPGITLSYASDGSSLLEHKAVTAPLLAKRGILQSCLRHYRSVSSKRRRGYRTNLYLVFQHNHTMTTHGTSMSR